jgi:O-methyltransferase
VFRLLKLLLSTYSRWLAAVGRTDRLFVMSTLGRRIMPEYRFKWPELDWWNDESFNRILRDFDELDGYNHDRRWMIDQLMRLVDVVPGDTAECGAYKGLGSYIICNRNRHSSMQGRIHHVFDSFSGLSQPSASRDGGYWKTGDLSVDEQAFRNNLKDFESSIRVYRGWIPTRFHEIADRTFSFVHVDVDLYQPTRDSIAFFYDRMSPGGIILCDDYGFGTCPGATAAVDAFLKDKPEKMISLPSGSGFLIRGLRTADAGCSNESALPACAGRVRSGN